MTGYFRKGLNIWLSTSKYVLYPEIPKSKKDAQKYLIIEFNTPTGPEPDPLLGIFSKTRPDIEKPYPLGTAARSSSSQWITKAKFPTVQFVVLFCTIPCLKSMPIFLHTIYGFTTRRTKLRKLVSNNIRSASVDKILIYTKYAYMTIFVANGCGNYYVVFFLLLVQSSFKARWHFELKPFDLSGSPEWPTGWPENLTWL